MKSTLNLHDFREGFKRLGWENFSYEGLAILFEYLEQWEEDTGEEIEYYPADLCCKFVEYGNIDEAASDYGISADELRDRTMVLEFVGGVIAEKF